MLSFQFGIGSVHFLPTTVGNPPSPASPQRILSIESGEVMFKGKNEKFMGQNKGPDDAAPSDEEATFKFATGRIGIDTFNMKFGETVATGYKKPNIDEGPTAIPTTPYQITVENAATFYLDLGVLNAGTLQTMQRVAGGPTAGQYSVSPSTGVYTFSEADNVSGTSVIISYLSTPASGGRTLTCFNRPQGYGPVWSIVIVAPYTSAAASSPLGAVQLRAARISEMGMPFKRNGYLLTPISGDIFPDASGAQYDIWSPN